MEVTHSRRRYIRVFCALFVISLFTACNPMEQPYYPHYQYHSPVDSTYKLIENLMYSYAEQNLDRYVSCIYDDFTFYYLSNGDTLYWDYNTEYEIHHSLFNNAFDIALALFGTEEYPWSGDTSGTTIVLPREYSLKVYMNSAHSIEYSASGTTDFLCSQDSAGEWHVWRMYDYPETGKEGWCDIKQFFMDLSN